MGFSAILVSSQDRLVRVMAGPYTGPQSLEQAKAALEAAGFRAIREWQRKPLSKVGFRRFRDLIA
jgi:cell division protein FtsN